MATKIQDCESTALSVWAIAVVLHIMCGTLLLTAGDESFSWELITSRVEDALEGNTPEIPSSFQLLLILGALHVAIGIFVGIVVLVGFLLWKKVLGVAVAIGAIQSLLCITTSVLAETILGDYHSAKDYDFQTKRLGSTDLPPLESTPDQLENARFNGVYIIVAATVAIVTLVPLTFATSTKPKTPPNQTLLFVPTICLCGVVSGLIIFCSSQTEFIILGTVWLVLSIAADVSINSMTCLGKKFNALLRSVTFAIVSLFAAITILLFSQWLRKGRHLDSQPVATVMALSDQDKLFYKLYSLMGDEGSLMYACVLISSAICPFACFSAFYALKSGFIAHDDAEKSSSSSSSSSSSDDEKSAK